VPLAKLANPAKMVLPVVLALTVTVVLQAELEKPALRAVPVNQVKTALQAAANTAHRLVWLQVIKRSRLLPSRANQQLQLGRSFNYDDQRHQFVKNIDISAANLHFIKSLVFL
jgi:hypothetical protein